MTGPNTPDRTATIFLIVGMMLCLTFGIVLIPAHSAAQTPAAVSVTIPSLPYPLSGLRKRLIDQGKAVPDVDVTLQSSIPAQYYGPSEDMPGSANKHAAIVALPDCDDHFPLDWITTLQTAGISVLLISPGQAHPAQDYCGGGQLQNPKHGLSFWAFDALSALDYLASQKDIDPDRIAVFGYGYGAGAAQLAIYRDGHAKHYTNRFRTLIGVRPQCMSEMNNFVPSLLIGVRNDPFNPPSWCKWRMDRDLTDDRAPVRFEMVESGEIIEKQATRKELKIETGSPTIALVTNFLAETGFTEKQRQN